MQFQGKTAVVFGGSGAIGAEVARVLARQGAEVHLAARGAERLERAARGIMAEGGRAFPFVADVGQAAALDAAMASVAAGSGRIDIAVNATGFPHDQGTELLDLSPEAFSDGFAPGLMAAFAIARAVVPHMGRREAGVIVTVVPPAGPMAVRGHLGHIAGCAGLEGFSRALAAELGPRNIRVVCLRSHAIPEALAAESYTRALFAPKAAAMGLSVEDWVQGAAGSTMLGRLPTLAQVAETVAFLASDSAGAMTAAVVNMTAGAVPD